MKVVLFCGGLGMRIREHSEDAPKPMIKIGPRPIIWHLMKYYAHYGHSDFILCLGYGAEYIRDYFLNYDERAAGDIAPAVGRTGGQRVGREVADWRITFADTGLLTNIGGRLRVAREFVEDEDVFLANYTDNLSDAALDKLVDDFLNTDAVAACLGVRPNVSYHLLKTDESHRVLDFCSVQQAELWTNGGFFIFRQEIFNYLREGEELVEEPFQRLISEGKLLAFRHDGFWACMDTYKEKQQLDELFASGQPPWQIW